eukprot:NODE_2_length_91304_cov_0.692462.p27 type:complete len:357 gc:universal NODE_2_length_91304_cov_0.692462:81738-80668(-)
MKPKFSTVATHDLNLYARQMGILGLTKHNILRNSKVLVIGCGGLGNTCIPYLYFSGITVGVSDDDLVEESNIHRQYLHSNNIGVKKSESLLKSMPNLKIESHFTKENSNMVENYDVIVDCVDDPMSKYLINEACLIYKKPWVSASAVALQGQITTFFPNSACYRCINPCLPPIISSCDDMGVIGSVPGTFGCLQAIEVNNILLGNSNLKSTLLRIQFNTWDIRKVKLRPIQSSCGACGTKKYPIESPVCEKSYEGIDLDTFLSIKDNSLIVDVRPAEKYSVYNIPNSINVPINHIIFNPEKCKNLILSHVSFQKHIIFICRRGHDSFIAYSNLNFDMSTYNFLGGYKTLCDEANFL